MENKKKIQRNLAVGFLSQVLTIFLGVILPRLVLVNYGSEVNGLINSVTQIYAYLSLLEAGIGTATLQALYKTVGEKDKKATNSVLAATDKYYKKTGTIYFIAIIVFSVVYPIFIRTDISLITVVLIIFFNGIGNVINFFFQAKYFLLLQAEGKSYIQTTLGMVTNVFKSLAKIFLISSGFDVVFVQAIAMIVSLIQMLYVTYYIKKRYSWIDLKTTPNYSAIGQSRNVMVHQISGLIFNNTDTIILTIFCGLKVVSVYSMYTLLFGMISTALGTIASSTVFAMGQMFHIDRKKFIKMYDAYEWIFLTLSFALYSIAYYFILPFMRLYTNGITDIGYIDKWLPVMFVSTYLLTNGRMAPNYVINFAGHFKETQFRSIIESFINLTVSVIAVQYIGIYGVLLGTIAALLYRANDIIIYANRVILKRSSLKTYRRWISNLIVFILLSLFRNLIPLKFHSYISIFLFCVPYSILTLIIFFGIQIIMEPSISTEIFHNIKKKIEKKEERNS